MGGRGGQEDAMGHMAGQKEPRSERVSGSGPDGSSSGRIGQGNHTGHHFWGDKVMETAWETGTRQTPRGRETGHMMAVMGEG